MVADTMPGNQNESSSSHDFPCTAIRNAHASGRARRHHSAGSGVETAHPARTGRPEVPGHRPRSRAGRGLTPYSRPRPPGPTRPARPARPATDARAGPNRLREGLGPSCRCWPASARHRRSRPGHANCRGWPSREIRPISLAAKAFTWKSVAPPAKSVAPPACQGRARHGIAPRTAPRQVSDQPMPPAISRSARAR